jgi:3-isopropylmalate/(R)-2-methylmalate dehydratase small subunit
MDPLTQHTGRGIALRRNDVDTDQIIPSDYCRSLTKTGYQIGLFAGWRQDSGFVFNDPDRADASVLVAQANFGTGSSREHAVWALRDWGIKAVIATSFGDIFRRNALTNGVLAVQLDEGTVAGLLDEVDAEPKFEITVDLEACEVRAGDVVAPFDIDQRARWLLLNGLDDIAVSLSKEDAIRSYESGRHHWLPSLGAGSISVQPAKAG